MKNKHLWVGYLTLSDKKKTLVASDERVETGKPKTLFLYNQERDQIIEYSREIIQAKLKDAPEVDYDSKKMSAAYKKALKTKLPNLYRIIFAANAGVQTPVKEKETASITDDDDDIDIDDNFATHDDDISDEDDESKELKPMGRVSVHRG